MCDEQLRKAAGHVHQTSRWLQASVSIKQGELGFKWVALLAIPTFWPLQQAPWPTRSKSWLATDELFEHFVIVAPHLLMPPCRSIPLGQTAIQA